MATAENFDFLDFSLDSSKFEEDFLKGSLLTPGVFNGTNSTSMLVDGADQDPIFPPLPDLSLEVGDPLLLTRGLSTPPTTTPKTFSSFPSTTRPTPSAPTSVPPVSSIPLPSIVTGIPLSLPVTPALTSFVLPSQLDSRVLPQTVRKMPTPTSTVPVPVTAVPVKQEPEKKRKTSGKILTTQEERAAARKVKHRLIDRARRRRVKNSIDQLRELVKLEPHEKSDKATIVSSAVREIQDLKSQIAQLQSQLQRTTISPPIPALEEPLPASPEEKSPIFPQEKYGVPSNLQTASMFAGLGGAGVCINVIGMDCKIKDVNGLFETITGYRKEELVGHRWIDPPLYGRHVHGEFPSKSFMRSSDPRLALVPTASANDFTCADFKSAVNALVHGGTFKVVSRILTRDGSILEALQTIFLIRGERGEGAALAAVSTPDTRRVLHLPTEDPFIDFPSPSSTTSSPQQRPHHAFSPDDFLSVGLTSH